MVLIPGNGKPRGFWKLAKVESLINWNDGQTRGAVVRVASADRRPTLLRRPLQLLYPLEIHDKIDSSSSGNDAVGNDSARQSPDAADNDSDRQSPDAADNDSNRQSPDAAANVSDRSTVNQVPRSRLRRVAAENAREIIRIQTEDS